MEFRSGQLTRQVPFEPLPTICEYSEFGSEEDYQTTGVDNSKLIKTRCGFSTRRQRFEEGQESEELQQPLLSPSTPNSKHCSKEWKLKLRKRRIKVQNGIRRKEFANMKWTHKLAKGWKMQKRKVKTAWVKSHRCRQLLKSSVKALSYSPILLLKTIKDAYVSVTSRLKGRCDQSVWHLAGARIL